MSGPRFTDDPGKSSPIHRQSGGGSFWTLSANKDASFVSTFWSVGYWAEEDPDNGISLFAIRGQEEGPVNFR